MIYLILLLSWGLYSLIEGYREAYYWHYKMNTNDHSSVSVTDLHPIFTMQRGIVSILIFFALTLILNVFASFIIMVGNTFIFSFLHNGMMYYIRNCLSKKMYPNAPEKWIYNKRWFAMSSTSTAKLTKIMTPTNRLIFGLIGLGCYIYVFIVYINIW